MNTYYLVVRSLIDIYLEGSVAGVLRGNAASLYEAIRMYEQYTFYELVPSATLGRAYYGSLGGMFSPRCQANR